MLPLERPSQTRTVDWRLRWMLATHKAVLPDWRPVGLFGDRLCAIRPYSPTVPKAVQVFVAWLRDALKDGFGLAP